MEAQKLLVTSSPKINWKLFWKRKYQECCYQLRIADERCQTSEN
jgi:hypothetical protein